MSDEKKRTRFDALAEELNPPAFCTGCGVLLGDKDISTCPRCDGREPRPGQVAYLMIAGNVYPALKADVEERNEYDESMRPIATVLIRTTHTVSMTVRGLVKREDIRDAALIVISNGEPFRYAFEPTMVRNTMTLDGWLTEIVGRQV